MNPNATTPTQPAATQIIVQPAPKKRKTLWITLAIVFAVLVIGGGIAAFVLLANGDKDAEAFLTSIENENYTAAYDQFLPELQAEQSFDAFQAGVATLNLTPDCEPNWTSLSIESSNGRTTRSSSGNLVCLAVTYAMSFDWVKQGDEYKLFSYSIRP